MGSEDVLYSAALKKLEDRLTEYKVSKIARIINEINYLNEKIKKLNEEILKTEEEKTLPEGY